MIGRFYDWLHVTRHFPICHDRHKAYFLHSLTTRSPSPSLSLFVPAQLKLKDHIFAFFFFVFSSIMNTMKKTNKKSLKQGNKKAVSIIWTVFLLSFYQKHNGWQVWTGQPIHTKLSPFTHGSQLIYILQTTLPFIYILQTTLPSS